MSYALVKNPMTDCNHRQRYNQLATDTFGLSFENWYASGYFDGSHIPYTLFDGNKAVANISINCMDVVFEGKTKKYLQLGTVMTDKDYRDKGLQKIIFDEILKDFEGKFDALFLFANKTVLDFYPKFGFEKAAEYSFTRTITGNGCPICPLNMQNPEDVALVRKKYSLGNPFSALTVVNGFALEMFYLGGPYADCVYYLPEYDAVVIAEKAGDSLTVLDIFCASDKSMTDIIAALCEKETKVTLGFSPKDMSGWTSELLKDEDTTLFVHKERENIFSGSKLLFPLIAHT